MLVSKTVNMAVFLSKKLNHDIMCINIEQCQTRNQQNMTVCRLYFAEFGDDRAKARQRGNTKYFRAGTAE